MNLPMWNLRLSNKPFNPSIVYEGHPTLFTIKLYHGGEFTNFRDRKYIDGKVNYVDMVDIDEFSIHDLDAIMRGLRYAVPPYIYYHFLVPNGDFQFGFRPLGNDADLLNLAQYVADHKLIRVYTEHGECTLLTYYMNPNPVTKVTLQQLDEDDEVGTAPVLEQVIETPSKTDALLVASGVNAIVPISPEYNKTRFWNTEKVLSSCSKRLIMEEFDIGLYQQILEGDSVEHVGTSATEQVVEEVVIEVVDDQVQQEVVADDHVLNEAVIEEDEVVNEAVIEEDEVVNEAVNEEFVEQEHFEDEVHVTEAQMDDFNLQDYMDFPDERTTGTGGGDDVELQGGDEVELQDGDNDQDSQTDDDDSEDSDYWVDEENLIPDIEVDMRDFHMSVDTDVEFMERPLNPNRGVDDNGNTEDLDVIDNDAWDSVEEDSDLDKKRRAVLKDLGKEKVCSAGEVHKVTFHIGQKYKDKKELKDKIQLHALESRRNVFFIKNDKHRLRAICKGIVAGGSTSDVTKGVRSSPRNRKDVGGCTSVIFTKGSNKGKGKDKNVQEKDSPCPWVIQASRSTTEENWYIKTYVPKHTCLHTRKIRSATTSFLSKQIMDQVETNLTVPVRSLQSQLQKKYHVGFSIHKIFRAKCQAKKIVQGDYTKQYEVLRDYILELQSTNPDTTVKLDLVSEPNMANVTTRCFKRLYICLGAMKKGFRAGMRDFLGLDGAFMKGPFPGQILTAVSVDSNNGIYPLAYAIVESENMQSWKWFLDCLGDDLDLYTNSNFTFISDRQKGLLPAIAQMFPNAEHRFCIRHIHENMKREWRSKEHKELLWKCAKATTVPEFNRLMQELSNFDNACYLWLKKIPPHHWARSHFTGRALTDMLLNNLCEVFNSKLIEGRDKPIISCLEYIREYMMKRICNVVKVQSKCVGPLTPTATKWLDSYCEMAKEYTARWNGGNKYQVQGPWEDQHVVDMDARECSCRKWELTGIPCKHVIAVLYDKADNGENVGELYTYVNRVHWLETWIAAYSFKIDPIKGRIMWPISDSPMKITPPKHHTQPGRPKRKRRKSMEERSQRKELHGVAGTQGSGTNLTRRFIRIRCGKCKHYGHNSRTCKGGVAGSQGGCSQGGGSQSRASQGV
ncbi:hypothetical protein LXL04_038244 [Taraxacum kok-saghyz]